MIKETLTHFMNHVVNQNSWAKPMLQSHAGKTVRFVMPPLQARLTVLENGGLAMSGVTAESDATITLPFWVAIRLMANDEQASSGIHIDGDAELAATVAKVLRQMSWQVEEDLSHVVGDIAAHNIASGAKQFVNESKRQAKNVAEMLVEYWQEEKPVLAKKIDIETFNHAVDTLRDDVARMEKRLSQLSQQLLMQQEHTENNSNSDNPTVTPDATLKDQ